MTLERSILQDFSADVERSKFCPCPTRQWWIVACILVLPLLTLIADFFGVFAGWITASLADPISFQTFLNNGLSAEISR